MREVDALSRGEGFGAGIIPEPGEAFLGLSMRDDEEQTEHFKLDAPTGRHDGREKTLGTVEAVGPALVLPVRVNLFLFLVVLFFYFYFF